MKVVSIVGARPQFIKAGLISHRLREKGHQEIFLHTGQHYDYEMSEIFFQELNLPFCDIYLGIGSGPHGKQTGMMLERIEATLMETHPDLVIVYGDTNSTLAGALAAAKLHIPIAHVEAGLRSYNKKMPEEINRVLTDHLSTFLFCPTQQSILNLAREGIHTNVFLVGDVMLDIALRMASQVDPDAILQKWNLLSKQFILVTLHRAENIDDPDRFLSLWNSLNQLAKAGLTLFFPVHPRTQNQINALNLKPQSPSLILEKPISYKEMIALESKAKLIITDSGGVQKEGYFFGTPCLIPRDETEWVELIEIGFHQLTTPEALPAKAISIYHNPPSHTATTKELYGDGNASEKIVTILETHFSRL